MAREAVNAGAAPRALVTALVELTQNLRIHGGADGQVSVRREAAGWTLETRNCVEPSIAEHVLEAVAAVNACDANSLHSLMRERRRAPLQPGAKGAGLGLLQLRRIATGPLSVRVIPPCGGEGKSGLVITMYLAHKNPVTDLDLAATVTTPKVHLPARGGEAWMSGACYPENAFSFFQPIFEWLRTFRSEGGKGRALEFNVKLDYFNTSSSKCLLDLFQTLQEAQKEGADTLVRWHYCEDDNDMRDSGEEFAQDLSLRFDLVPY